MAERRLPMFPLQSVLVPNAPLPLHVFEPRYRALMDDVLATDEREFGVVLIERGSEVGGGDVRSRVGTIARILQAEQADDGRWGVLAMGTRRIDVAEWLADDPYPVAMVVDRPDEDWTEAASAAMVEVEPVVRHCLAMKAEVGDRAVAATVELEPEPVVRAWQLVAIAPIATFDRQALLVVDQPAERLETLRELVTDEAAVLAQRMHGL